MNAAGYDLDNSFEIRHLSFGRLAEFDLISEDFPDAGLMHPLDGYEVVRREGEKQMKCGFYIKAVPAVFEGDVKS